MEPRTITLIVMAVSAVLLIGWDIVVAFFNKVPNDKDTISGITYGASLKVWTIPYAVGVLCGHLFMPGVFLDTVRWWGVSILLAVGIGFGVFSLLRGKHLSQSKWRIALRGYGTLNAGIVMGWLFWTQG